MSTPLETLFALNDATRNLDMVQIWIDTARAVNPTNQQIQLEMDRRQNSVDERRAEIELTKLQISISN